MSATTLDAMTRAHVRVIDLARLRRDGGTQPRVELDEETVREYVERMKPGQRGVVLDAEGLEFAPLAVFDDGEHLWLADGFHRVEAARRRGWSRFQADVRPGTLREAIEFSLGANARHGKRRTNADKRRAVEKALADEGWSSLSDSKLAQMCCVSQPFVSKVRRELVESGEIDACVKRRGADGKLYSVQNIGGQSPGRRGGEPCVGASGVEVEGAVSSPVVLLDHLSRQGLSEGGVGVLMVRDLERAHWYEIANEGVPLLDPDGVLIVPQTLDLSFAVSHLIRERIEYLGATVLPGPKIFQVWSCERRCEVPVEAGSLEQLARALGDEARHIVEYRPRG